VPLTLKNQSRATTFEYAGNPYTSFKGSSDAPAARQVRVEPMVGTMILLDEGIFVPSKMRDIGYTKSARFSG